PDAAAGLKAVKLHGKPVECVGSFKYLGTEVGCDGSTDAETHRRCGLALGVVRQVSPVWRDSSVPTHLKADLFRSLSLSVALYNAETWTISPAAATSLRQFQDSALRYVLGGHYRNAEKSREELCAELGLQAIEDEVRCKRIGWIAHTCRGMQMRGRCAESSKR
ncbi:unnamed protein product, partial [Amoebophrya sp. A120]